MNSKWRHPIPSNPALPPDNPLSPVKSVFLKSNPFPNLVGLGWDSKIRRSFIDKGKFGNTRWDLLFPPQERGWWEGSELIEHIKSHNQSPPRKNNSNAIRPNNPFLFRGKMNYAPSSYCLNLPSFYNVLTWRVPETALVRNATFF